MSKQPEPCEACTGRGVVSFATEDVPCAACNGTGNASGKGKVADAIQEQAAADNQ